MSKNSKIIFFMRIHFYFNLYIFLDTRQRLIKKYKEKTIIALLHFVQCLVDCAHSQYWLGCHFCLFYPRITVSDILTILIFFLSILPHTIFVFDCLENIQWGAAMASLLDDLFWVNIGLFAI